MTGFDSPAARKAMLRESMSRLRSEFGGPGAGPAHEAAARNLLGALPPPPGAIVAGYWPIGDEMDPRPLLLALAARGHPLALPVTPARGRPLSFRAWAPGGALVPGRYGTSEPAPDAAAAVPGFLLVPLLAFDHRCNRLGYGAGYYDRTLAALPPDTVAAGLAFAAQEVVAVPVDPDDVALRAVATERGVIFRGRPAPGGKSWERTA